MNFEPFSLMKAHQTFVLGHLGRNCCSNVAGVEEDSEVHAQRMLGFPIKENPRHSPIVCSSAAAAAAAATTNTATLESFSWGLRWLGTLVPGRKP